ncbi:MAG TPA: dienelactone hydrolase family protein [Acidimicrobiales bacterium]|nr:dienelactone hydrolase family protein [Acidimicrobiales bacterium]
MSDPPTTENYPEVTVEEVTVPTREGELPALVFSPPPAGRRPAVVLAAEAFGINDFTRQVAATLAHLGYVTVVPDYYRGAGPEHPESYDDFTEVIEHIGRLDFRRAALDVVAAVEQAEGLDAVDPRRVAVWGYCTGGTLALLAAELRPELAAAVLFFPSQPTFAELDDRHPVHPIDLLWSIGCPVLVMYGDEDPVMPAERLADLERRLAAWHVDADVRTYPGAGHAFSAPAPPLHHEAADRASWADALEFLARHLGSPV